MIEKNFLQKTPSWIKILFLPAINILFFCLPKEFSYTLIVVQFFIACFCRINLKKQISAFKPVIYYAVLLYFTTFISLLLNTLNFNASNDINDADFFETGLTQTENESPSKNPWGTVLLIAKICFSNSETAIMLIKLFCVMQSALLLYETTTPMEIRFGIEKIESFIRKILPCSKKNSFTDTISLFINFIPMVKDIWNQSKRAWKARHGKSGFKMYAVLLPVLFSVGLKKAYNTAKAISIRQNPDE